MSKMKHYIDVFIAVRKGLVMLARFHKLFLIKTSILQKSCARYITICSFIY